MFSGRLMRVEVVGDFLLRQFEDGHISSPCVVEFGLPPGTILHSLHVQDWGYKDSMELIIRHPSFDPGEYASVREVPEFTVIMSQIAWDE